MRTDSERGGASCDRPSPIGSVRCTLPAGHNGNHTANPEIGIFWTDAGEDLDSRAEYTDRAEAFHEE